MCAARQDRIRISRLTQPKGHPTTNSLNLSLAETLPAVLTGFTQLMVLRTALTSLCAATALWQSAALTLALTSCMSLAPANSQALLTPTCSFSDRRATRYPHR